MHRQRVARGRRQIAGGGQGLAHRPERAAGGQFLEKRGEGVIRAFAPLAGLELIVFDNIRHHRPGENVRGGNPGAGKRRQEIGQHQLIGAQGGDAEQDHDPGQGAEDKGPAFVEFLRNPDPDRDKENRRAFGNQDEIVGLLGHAQTIIGKKDQHRR